MPRDEPPARRTLAGDGWIAARRLPAPADSFVVSDAQGRFVVLPSAEVEAMDDPSSSPHRRLSELGFVRRAQATGADVPRPQAPCRLVVVVEAGGRVMSPETAGRALACVGAGRIGDTIELRAEGVQTDESPALRLLDLARRRTPTGIVSFLNIERNATRLLDALVASRAGIHLAFDGPANVHEAQRSLTQAPRHEDVVAIIRAVHHRLDAVSAYVNGVVTVTRATCEAGADAIVDACVQAGLVYVLLRPVPLRWRARAGDQVPTAEEYDAFHRRALDLVLERNVGGALLVEKRLALTLDVFAQRTDARRAWSEREAVVAIAPDGVVYATESAALEGDARDALGDVTLDAPAELSRRAYEHAARARAAIGDDPACSACAYERWCGASLLRQYAADDDAITKGWGGDYCRSSMGTLDGVFSLIASDRRDALREASRAWSTAQSSVAARSRDAPVRHVAVVGGGSAGYLTALALRRLRPDVRVTLLESSSIPIIGVGEATTPDLVEFLLDTLGVDELELHREVRPTWKLGIRFFWGPPGPSHFHHPFRGEHLLQACAAGDQDLQSLGAQLMARGLSPVLREPDGRITPLLRQTPYAYHLDNARFVRFLRVLAARSSIEIVDCIVEDAVLTNDGDVDHLRTRDGRSLSFDFYVDATGFRSLLLGEKLGVPYQSYAPSLFTDCAVVADVPHAPQATLDPFTFAETMDAGWCWKIPTPEENHRGYVFASRFLSADAAEAELRRKNPTMGEPRLVRFQSGRRAECWVRNVFAVGNAYAFVEPLESTALHMLIYEIRLLSECLPRGETSESMRARVNGEVGAHWDFLRDFLALHYRFNRKLDTAFWQTCREEVALCGGEGMVAAYREGAPLTARPDRARLEDSLLRGGFFGLLGIDNVLYGQRVEARMLRPGGESAAFHRFRQELPSILARALPHREGLAAYQSWLEAQR